MDKYIVKAKKYKVKDGDSIKSLADEAGITWQELARFNWGTSEPNKINKFLRNKVGCRKKTRDGNNYIFTSNDDPGIIYIPSTFQPKEFQSSTDNILKVEIPSSNYKDATIKGIYAQKHLEELAERLSEPAFISILVPIFGGDIKGEAYRKLYRELSDKALPEPNYKIEPNLIKDKKGRGHVAAYNNSTQTIHIYHELVDNAISEELSQLKSEDDSILFTALLEEFGHYIDDRLRNVHDNIGGDASLDEGSKFAYNIAFFEVLETPKIHFADVDHPSYKGPLNLDFTEAYDAISNYASPKEQTDDDVYERWEFFGEGYGDVKNPRSYAHRSIELVLEEVGFSKHDLKRIYFGNWMRDNSQVIDPNIIRPADKFLAAAQAEYKKTRNLPPALDGTRLSRKALTKVMAFKALIDFSKDKKVKERNPENAELAKSFFNLLMGPNGMDELKGYRPQEHIDNPGPEPDPKDWADCDNSKVDDLFPPPPKTSQVEIDKKTGIANYIATATPDQSFPPAFAYLEERFSLAVNAGYTDEGLRRFGEGLHVLEDFFAHSNFTEIALRKMGFNVYPWVEPFNMQRIPLVTGMFGKTDVIGSLAPEFVDILIPHEIEDYEFVKSGELTPQDDIILILLEDIDEAQEADTTVKNPNYKGKNKKTKLKPLYEQYLKIRDILHSEYLLGNAPNQLYRKLNFYVDQINKYVLAIPKYIICNTLANMVDDLQTWTDQINKSSIGTHPTHTMLAKDHDDRPLHELAAKLAQQAVKKVGHEMFNCMKNKNGDPVTVAKSFIGHPLDSNWFHGIVAKWATENEKQINIAKDRNLLFNLSQKEVDEIRADIEAMKQAYKKVEDSLKMVNKKLKELYDFTDSRFFK